jgi:hypothetical protein
MGGGSEGETTPTSSNASEAFAAHLNHILLCIEEQKVLSARLELHLSVLEELARQHPNIPVGQILTDFRR